MNRRLVYARRRINKATDNPRVLAALDAMTCSEMTEADFLDLALACLDQADVSVEKQADVLEALGELS